MSGLLFARKTQVPFVLYLPRFVFAVFDGASESFVEEELCQLTFSLVDE